MDSPNCDRTFCVSALLSVLSSSACAMSLCCCTYWLHRQFSTNLRHNAAVVAVSYGSESEHVCASCGAGTQTAVMSVVPDYYYYYNGTQTWGEILLEIEPYSYAALGVGLSVGLSVIGAAWYVLCFLRFSINLFSCSVPVSLCRSVRFSVLFCVCCV